MAPPQPIRPPVVLELAALPNAVGSARRHTRDLLGRWGYAVAIEPCELLVSELLTNAVKASEPPDEPVTYSERHERLGVVKLRLFPTETSIFIEVWDANPTPPVLKDQELEAENGRGMFLVELLSVRWNVHFPRHGGKIVWAEVRHG